MIHFILFYLRIYYNTIGLIFPKNSVKKLEKLFSTPRKTVLRKKEIEVLNEAKQSAFKTKEYEIAVYEWGEGNDYVLLCHGWESNAGSLGAFVKPITNMGYKVIAFDGPAHGKSTGKISSLIKFKEVFIELVHHYGLPKIAIGHSLGANTILLACAEQQLEIVGSYLFAPVNKVAKVFYDFKSMISIPNSLFNKLEIHLQSKTGYRLNELNFEEIAPKTRLKYNLVLHDLNDQITPVKHSKDIVKNWPNAQFQEIQGTGHYRILWNEKAVDSVINHLKNKWH